MKIRLVGTELLHSGGGKDGLTYRHDEADSRI